MKAFKPNIIDIVIIGIVCTAILMPSPSMLAKNGLSLKSNEVLQVNNRSALNIAKLQAATYKHPERIDSYSNLVDLIIDFGHLDQAIRISSAYLNEDDNHKWQRHLEHSGAYAERFQVAVAIEHAELAYQHCKRTPNHCTIDKKSKLEMFLHDLRAVKKVIDGGIDPHRDGKTFKEEMDKYKNKIRIPTIKL